VKAAVATVFPELFTTFLETGVVGRAVKNGVVTVKVLDIRDHPVDARGSVDDYQFGGGAGMIMRPEPLFETLESLDWHRDARVILLSPQGRRLDTGLARELAEEERIVLFCGRYGGLDERFRQAVTDEVCVGDTVVSGGEIPAMFLLDAVFRWIPGVLGRYESAESDSFATGLLDYPRYTRPAEFRGMKVPDVLLSGNHREIISFRYRAALEKTRHVRPELLEDGLSDKDREQRFGEVMHRADRAKE
jgi:tRNA (guanine37-N1)-methyltransferase